MDRVWDLGRKTTLRPSPRLQRAKEQEESWPYPSGFTYRVPVGILGVWSPVRSPHLWGSPSEVPALTLALRWTL